MPFFSSSAQYSRNLSAGTGVPPSPPMAVVTPSINLFSAKPFFGSTGPDWSIMSIQPGETYRPRASISVLPLASTFPIFAKRPSLIATSANTHGFPAPSSTRPPRITMSYSESAALLLGGLLQQGQASPSIMVTARRQDSVQEAHGCRIGGPEGGRFNGNEEAPDGQSA